MEIFVVQREFLINYTTICFAVMSVIRYYVGVEELQGLLATKK